MSYSFFFLIGLVIRILLKEKKGKAQEGMQCQN